MSKTISWPARVTYILIALALALSLAGMTAVSADPAKESEWDDVSTPSGDGLVVFFPGCDILDFDIGPDGEVIYAVVEVGSLGCKINTTAYDPGATILLKSEDSGATWSDITDELPEDADLILVSVAPDNADFVVVASVNEVYGSNEGGDDFEDTGLSGITAGKILCLDVSSEVDDDEWNIAVGTDAGEIYRFVSGGYWRGNWKKAMPTEPTLPDDYLWVDEDWTSTDFPSGLTWGTNAFDTISGAITAADPNDTIYVLPGIYNEQVAIPTEKDGLTLAGNSATDTIIQAPSGITTINVASQSVTIRGFWIKAPLGTLQEATISLAAGAVGTEQVPGVIEHNKIEGVVVATKPHANIVLREGIVYWEIKDNEFVVGETGIAFGGADNILVSDNTFSGGSAGCGSTDNTDSVTISYNDFLGSTVADSEAIGLGASITDMVIEYNTITGYTNGIRVWSDLTAGEVAVHYNNISDNGAFGILAEDAVAGAPLNATHNYWGAADGPYCASGDYANAGIGDHVTGATTGLADGAVDCRAFLTEPEPDAGATPTEYPGIPSLAPVGDYAGWVPSEKVTTVAFSPNFDADETILVISTVEVGEGSIHTYLQSGRWGTAKEWNEEVSPLNVKAVEIVDKEAVSSGIAIPSDYDGFTSSLRKVFVYVNTDNTDGHGYLFRIDSSKIHFCLGEESSFGPDGNPLLASLAYYGAGIDGKFMLGTKDATKVWHAEDMDFCCPEWSGASKKPTGSDALVAFTPDGKKGYAATADDESAFSVSLDGNGQYWNQLSLIDTNIDYLSDVAVNPDCGTTLLFSVNEDGYDSVWFKAEDLPEASEYNGVWLREWCGDLEGSPEIGLIRLAPEETERVFTVYLVDRGTDNIWHNDSSGLTKWLDRHCTRIDEITDLAVESEGIIYALSATNGDVSRSTNNGRKWSSVVDAKVADGHTIAVLGDSVLVGGLAGSVGYSDDGGDSFSRLGDKGALTGNVHVAFDSYFEDNDTVYAAVADPTREKAGGIYRWVIDDSTSWKDLKARGKYNVGTETTPDYVFYNYCGIVLDNAAGNPMTDEDTGGVLYAVYDVIDAPGGTTITGSSGMARWLDPCKSPGAAKWDYLINSSPGAEAFIAEPAALKICGCLTEDSNSLLWAINTAEREGSYYDLVDGDDNLFVYEDCLAKEGVELSKVKDEALIPSDPCECWNEKFVLEWGDLCNSSTYELQIALDEDFDFTVDLGDLAIPDDEFVLIPDDTLDCNETYYWRVRVIKADSDAEVIRSWWSDGWSFTVQAGPAGAIQLTAPESGAADVAIEGVAFTWTSVAAATSYDFALMDSAGSVVSSETGLTGTAYTCPETLSYDATYTWKVTAMKDGSVLSESSLSTFRTVTAAVFTCPQCGLSFPSDAALKAHIDEAHAPVEPTTPAWVWVVIGLGAVLVITILVLIFRTRRI